MASPKKKRIRLDFWELRRVKGTVPFSLRKACAKIGTVPDHWHTLSWDLPEHEAEYERCLFMETLTRPGGRNQSRTGL